MRFKLLPFYFFVILLFLHSSLWAQSPEEQIQMYKEFLNSNQNLSTSDLFIQHPAGIFKESLDGMSQSPLYLDSIEIKYGLTDDEKYLLEKHGFVVTERLSRYSFGMQFADVYQLDLPVFVSTDAVLHAFHSSYDKILKNIELGILIDRIRRLLLDLRSKLPELDSRYSSNPAFTEMLKDIDVYLTVPAILLGENIEPYYQDNSDYINELLSYIDQLELKEIPLFSETPRKIDFSQFKPRGHYTDEWHPELSRYFKAMIWFGRTELYLISPETAENKPTFADIQRQVIDAALINELSESAGIIDDYNEIEKIISSFVGEQDNVTLTNLHSLLSDFNIGTAEDFLDSNKVVEFQDSLSNKSYAFQRILSQVLINGPMTPDGIKPASAFMLFGQRFVIDSYVTANVVYDNIIYQGERMKRMLPSTLDILFALGNNAAAQLLKPDLDEYNYSTNLTSLRYLVDAYEEEFWNSSIYNSWLNSIRSLNPPESKSDLPEFMQTAAWWQQKMNTQLASWTELRHDNLLYAKQSYTGGVSCSFPYSYVEPIPIFYQSMINLTENFSSKINNITFEDPAMKNSLNNYFDYFGGVMDTLKEISIKELNGNTFTDEEISFLKSMISQKHMGCVTFYDGWYSRLYYYPLSEQQSFQPDYLVADYHTAPTDAGGSYVGWVKHAGTGDVDLAVVSADLPDGRTAAFIGPVMSYYEYTTSSFNRLTDEDWKDTYLSESLRPDWTNLYLADNSGQKKTSGAMLITGIDNKKDNNAALLNNSLIAANYPNPFNNSTIINFTVPHELANSSVAVIIYNIQGKEIKRLVNENLPGGNYLVEWEGKNSRNGNVSSGVYFYEVRIGNQSFVGKMNLLK